VSVDDHVRVKLAALAEFDVLADDAIRTDFAVRADAGLRVDDSGGMNHGNCRLQIANCQLRRLLAVRSSIGLPFALLASAQAVTDRQLAIGNRQSAIKIILLPAP
jgi:hypothetical protein